MGRRWNKSAVTAATPSHHPVSSPACASTNSLSGYPVTRSACPPSDASTSADEASGKHLMEAQLADIEFRNSSKALTSKDDAIADSGQPDKRKAKELLSGYRVAFPDGRSGEVEFVATTGEALVSIDNGRPRKRPYFEETPREWVDGVWPEQVWADPGQIHVQQKRHQLRERRDVADFRHSLRCIQGRNDGQSSKALAEELGRPEEWVAQAWSKGTPVKPKHMEHWDADGFCEVRYLKKRYHREGLYETIVQGVDWQQDRVWRVHKDTDGNWNLRTVKQCEHEGCGRSLQRVPDSTVKIGPGDSGVPKGTRPHSDWCCQKQFDGCLKRTIDVPIGTNFYWWCPKHKWYVCQNCQQNMPDKPTSKQIRGWYRGECPALDDLVMKVVDDFNLPDPQAPYGGTARYTIKMNWYPDGMAQVTDHRHDVWTILVSLGSPRVLNVDYARVLMDDGDVILFGTQKHGVPVAAPSQGGRLSLVMMFQPDSEIERAALYLAGRMPDFKPRQRLPQVLDWAPEDEDQGEAWSDDRYSEDDLATLCALGFTDVEAQQALMACGGDVSAAANLLLGV